jgi:hypothetical protein
MKDPKPRIIEGGSALVNAFTNAWSQNLAHIDDEDDDFPVYVDPDLPVWGTINKDEVI